jgi:ketosteroid isomerase-like protein
VSAEIEELASLYGVAWASRDLDAIMALHTEETVFHLHGGGEPAVGHAATRAAFAAGIAQWPDLTFTRSAVHFGDRHFVTQYRMSGTGADGGSFSCEGADVFAVENGRIARKDSYLDWPALQQQLAGGPASARQ